ncbi:hypothetical protein Cfor_12045 [Coptotermes formosanus]|uniref:Transmembrane protein 267 n=1 Tax=Coptotermes formosanus TaxID=36987 RepID=A0A6L2PU92_COPFO|nr:hypothetical protein Cfor_12045 [Coptotermes formosanus]
MLWIVRAVCTSKIAATLCMGVVAFLGDHIVERSALPEDMRAVVDNMTHGAIGLLSWHIVTAHLRDLSLSMRVCEVLFCGLIASAVDLDHFAAARSFRIQDARQLSSRSPMHCTSVTLAVSGLMLLLAHVFQWPSLHHFTWILVAAVVGHHLRDATRRGLWLCPFGSSPPIPYTGYMVGCMLLPHVVPSLMQWTQLTHHPATSPSVELVVSVTEESLTGLVQFQANELSSRGRQKPCVWKMGFRFSLQQ